MFSFNEKALDFIKCNSLVDILEGTARSGKTTAMAFKFGLRVASSSHNQHIISASDASVARRNIIDCKNGFKEMFGSYVREGTDVKKGNHLIFTINGKDNYIYIVGFRDKARWEKILGSTCGCVLVDEINAANEDFLAQAFRSGASVEDWYFCASLNPSNPNLPIYKDIINKCRPTKKWSNDVPFSIQQDLKKEKFAKGYYYWHFNFNDNPVMTQELIERFKAVYPVGSFYYNSLVLGLRGVAEGVIFAKYINDWIFQDIGFTLTPRNQKTQDEMEVQSKIIKFAIGLDLGNNEIKKGTILTLTAIMHDYKEVNVLDVLCCKETETNALVLEICNKINEWYEAILQPYKIDSLRIDGYGAIGILIPTIRKKLQEMNINIFTDLAIKFGNDGGRSSRLILMLLLINQQKIHFSTRCRDSVNALKSLVYNDKDNLPLDENQQEMDYYDSLCYSITPFTTKLNERIER